jgi:DNA repair exonuclease SbcCD ATPase subunit
MAQSLTPAEQIDELRRVLAERDSTIAALDAERAEAALLKARLTTALLEIEHIKLQLAMLRRQRFGQSSERLDREIAQLEMRLEDFEETLGEQIAATAPQHPARTQTASEAVRAQTFPRPSAARGGDAPT